MDDAHECVVADSRNGWADASLFEVVADFERRKIIETLETVNWSQTDAAEKLGIPLSTLNQKIKRLNIEVKRKGSSSASVGLDPVPQINP